MDVVFWENEREKIIYWIGGARKLTVGKYKSRSHNILRNFMNSSFFFLTDISYDLEDIIRLRCSDMAKRFFFLSNQISLR